jgi:hypothetical protein
MLRRCSHSQGLWVISSGRPRAPVRMVTMRKAADEAAEDMAAHLAAEQARAREAHERPAEAIASHAAEVERIRARAAERELDPVRAELAELGRA